MLYQLYITLSYSLLNQCSWYQSERKQQLKINTSIIAVNPYSSPVVKCGLKFRKALLLRDPGEREEGMMRVPQILLYKTLNNSGPLYYTPTHLSQDESLPFLQGGGLLTHPHIHMEPSVQHEDVRGVQTATADLALGHLLEAYAVPDAVLVDSEQPLLKHLHVLVSTALQVGG